MVKMCTFCKKQYVPAPCETGRDCFTCYSKIFLHELEEGSYKLEQLEKSLQANVDIESSGA